jgi:DNA-directed RNA polymerase subunit H (RpoH/RPB5)
MGPKPATAAPKKKSKPGGVKRKPKSHDEEDEDDDGGENDDAEIEKDDAGEEDDTPAETAEDGATAEEANDENDDNNAEAKNAGAATKTRNTAAAATSDDDDDSSSASSSGSDSDDNDEEESSSDEEESEPETKTPSKKKTRKPKAATAAAASKTPRLSAAMLKTRMSPNMLQNAERRKIIWRNLMRLMERRGYTWVQDRPPPTDTEMLLPNAKHVLGSFHMHAVDADPTESKREPVYVVFCSRAGEPTLKHLQYPSRHILVVSDSLTPRLRAALATHPLKAPPLASTGAGRDLTALPTKENTLTFKDVFVEPLQSSFFLYDLLNQRYLRTVTFSPTSPDELQRVFDVFERKRDLSKFPRFLDSDPVVRYMRIPAGTVVKLPRLSTTAGIQRTYRAVVHQPS